MAAITEISEKAEVNAMLQRMAVLLSNANGKEVPTTLSKKNTYTALLTKPGEWRHTPVDDTTRRYIKLEQSFLHQFEQQASNFAGQTKYVLQEKMKISSELLLHCFPDAISLQLTDEGSLFYTVRKNDIHIYLQHYLFDEFDGTDEAIVSVFRGDEKLLDYGGTLAETIAQLSAVLAKESIVLPELA
jgi:hypothetical protein